MFFKEYRMRRRFRHLVSFAKTDIINPPAKYGHVFVFGSNLMGDHAGGAAKYAKEKFHAQQGVGQGPTGGAYAIPTVDFNWNPIDIEHIKYFVLNFLREASANPKVTYHLTPIGCGIAGHKVEDIVPLFIGATKNVIFPRQFLKPLYQLAKGIDSGKVIL